MALTRRKHIFCKAVLAVLGGAAMTSLAFMALGSRMTYHTMVVGSNPNGYVYRATRAQTPPWCTFGDSSRTLQANHRGIQAHPRKSMPTHTSPPQSTPRSCVSYCVLCWSPPETISHCPLPSHSPPTAIPLTRDWRLSFYFVNSHPGLSMGCSQLI